MPHASSPTISTSPTPLTIYMHHKNVYVPLFYSISTTFVSYYPCITLEHGHALSRWRPRHFVKSIPRILRKRERNFVEKQIPSYGGAIYLQTFHHFFPPLLSSFSLFLLEHFPIPSLFPSRPPQTLVSTPFFFFFFVSFCRHRLSVTHCPRYCDNVLRVTKLYSLRRKEKLGPYKHRNTLVDVLKRVFPRFRSPSPSILYSGRALLFPA